MQEKKDSKFFTTDKKNKLYELTDSQKLVVDSYYNFIEQNFLDPLFSNKPEENKRYLQKEINLLLEQNNKTECTSYFNSHFSEDWHFLLTPVLAILELKKGIIFLGHPLNAALDYRLSRGNYNLTDKSEEKLAIGNYLISLINNYLDNVILSNTASSRCDIAV